MLVPTVTLFLFDYSLFKFELSFRGSLKEILLLERMLDDAWIVVVFASDLNEETLRLVFRYGLVTLLPWNFSCLFTFNASGDFSWETCGVEVATLSKCFLVFGFDFVLSFFTFNASWDFSWDTWGVEVATLGTRFFGFGCDLVLSLSLCFTFLFAFCCITLLDLFG